MVIVFLLMVFLGGINVSGPRLEEARHLISREATIADEVHEALVAEMVANIMAARSGWHDGDHGGIEVSRTPEHQANVDRVMAAYGDSIRKLDNLTPEEAAAISPKLDPSKVYGISETCGEDGDLVQGTISVWEYYADMELTYEGGEGHEVRWVLTGLDGIAPERPEGWALMSAEERYTWQNDQNFVSISVRTRAPQESAPTLLRLRPANYFSYFEEEHDWCDPFHQDENGNCRQRNTRISRPIRLQTQDGDAPVIWAGGLPHRADRRI